MAEKLYRVCGRCNGLGYCPGVGGLPAEDPCVTCGGEKYVETGQQIDLSSADDEAETAIAAVATTLSDLADAISDLADVANDIKDKCDDIFEAVTEE